MSKTKPCDSHKPRRGNIISWSWWMILIIIVATALIRIRLLAAPLERDEGEYAYAGQLMLQSVPPYAQAYNMKMPGIYAAYALILAVFGQTQTGIHLGLLLVNTATIILVFLLAKELFDLTVGVVAAAAFALLSLGQSVLGVFAHAEHFVILPALGGILLMIHSINYQKQLSLLAAGILLGLAFLMKQHGAAFVAFAGLYLFFRELRRRPFAWKNILTRIALFLAAVLLQFALTCLILWRAGVFEKFWFWTVEYAAAYVSRLPLSAGLNYLKASIAEVAGPAVLIWVLAGVGLAALFWNKRFSPRRLFVTGFVVFSFLAVCPGFYFREHYFILFLPAVALLAGIAAASIIDIFTSKRSSPATMVIPVLLILAVLFSAVYQQWNFFFTMSPTVASRTTYGCNPFPESLEIARFIREHSAKDDRIAVIGSEPQIYFYSNRRSATGYIYTYPLMEPHPYALRMQKEMSSEIENAQPEFLVFVNVPTSWLVRADSEKMIFDWFQQYQQKYYQQVGIVDILSLDQTIYRWGQDSIGYLPRSQYWVSILQRKSYPLP